jgi:hypothetical protein
VDLLLFAAGLKLHLVGFISTFWNVFIPFMLIKGLLCAALAWRLLRSSSAEPPAG